MTQQRFFDKNYLNQEFAELNTKTTRSLTLFLIGGGAMAFYGLKEATKDVDIILTNPDALDNLKTALQAIGYKELELVLMTRAYNKMQASVILENEKGFRWDLFVNKVCNALTLSCTMKQRSTQLYEGDRLSVFIASKEDVFLLKGITEREADLEDMRLLAESGLNWAVINQECQSQSSASGVPWTHALYQNLLDLKTKYNIESPIEKPLRAAAKRQTVKKALLREIEKGNRTVKSISQAIREPQSFVRTELKRLTNSGLITVDKAYKPYKFYINKKQT